jgi:16S rRNA (uracil1498-N3)-methyltransferase
MKNVPRVFVDQELSAGARVVLSKDQNHYITHVMRADRFLVFNNGAEWEAEIAVRGSNFVVRRKTNRLDPSSDFVFCFAPIKKAEDLISGVVQMGAGALQPVITEHSVVRNINRDRMKKIIIESAEQSGRNSIPELRPLISFKDLDKKGLIFGDERKSWILGMKEWKGPANADDISKGPSVSALRRGEAGEVLRLLVGPEGGFSEQEFNALDIGGAIGVSLGPLILRAEVAAVALCATTINS